MAGLGGFASMVVECLPGVWHVLGEVFFDADCERLDFSLCVLCCAETDEVHEGACVDCPVELCECAYWEDDSCEFFRDIVGEEFSVCFECCVVGFGDVFDCVVCGVFFDGFVNVGAWFACLCAHIVGFWDVGVLCEFGVAS